MGFLSSKNGSNRPESPRRFRFGSAGRARRRLLRRSDCPTAGACSTKIETARTHHRRVQSDGAGKDAARRACETGSNLCRRLCSTAKVFLNQKELDIFSSEIIAEMTGYGPIEPLLKDPTVTDILINTHRRCYIERFGQLQETKVHFKDEAHLLRIINRIVSAIGRRVDESRPMVDARLNDGSRVNIVFPPLALDGPLISIRKFAERRLRHADRCRLADPAVGDVLRFSRRGRRRIA